MVGQVVPTDRCKAGEQNLQGKQSARGSALSFRASDGGCWGPFKLDTGRERDRADAGTLGFRVFPAAHNCPAAQAHSRG
jgi:hypothetical protein